MGLSLQVFQGWMAQRWEVGERIPTAVGGGFGGKTAAPFLSLCVPVERLGPAVGRWGGVHSHHQASCINGTPALGGLALPRMPQYQHLRKEYVQALFRAVWAGPGRAPGGLGSKRHDRIQFNLALWEKACPPIAHASGTIRAPLHPGPPAHPPPPHLNNPTAHHAEIGHPCLGTQGLRGRDLQCHRPATANGPQRSPVCRRDSPSGDLARSTASRQEISKAHAIENNDATRMKAWASLAKVTGPLLIARLPSRRPAHPASSSSPPASTAHPPAAPLGAIPRGHGGGPPSPSASHQGNPYLSAKGGPGPHCTAPDHHASHTGLTKLSPSRMAPLAGSQGLLSGLIYIDAVGTPPWPQCAPPVGGELTHTAIRPAVGMRCGLPLLLAVLGPIVAKAQLCCRRDEMLDAELAVLGPIVSKPYVLVVVGISKGPKVETVSAFWALDVYKKMSRPYKKNVKHILVVQPSAWAKMLLFLATPFVSSKAADKVKKVEVITKLKEATDGEVDVYSLGVSFLTFLKNGANS
eukprot:gene595-2017_t